MRVSPFFWISVAAQGMRHGRRLAWNRCRFGQSRFMRHRRRSLWNRRRFDSVVAILAISSSTCIAAAGSTISPSTRRYRHRLDEKLLCDLADDYFRNIAIVSIASSFEGLRKPNKGEEGDLRCLLLSNKLSPCIEWDAFSRAMCFLLLPLWRCAIANNRNFFEITRRQMF